MIQIVFALLYFSIGLSATQSQKPVGNKAGNATIRAKAGKSEIVIATTERLAGAIHSLTWDGKEFIDSADHGRQLQSACSFDCSKPGEFWAECFNPTEAGSRRDGAGQKSTSQLLELKTRDRELFTKTQMAFWLAPGEKSEKRPALNDQLVSNHLVTKKVVIGLDGFSNVIDYDVTFTVPGGEKHRFAQFEAVTGYMPAEFEKFWQFNPSKKSLETLSDGPGEQEYPVILSTKSGSHAMGVYSPDQPSKGFEKAGYGRFRFPSGKVTKWNCVFRIATKDSIKPGDYRFRMFVIVGTLEDVKGTMSRLIEQFPSRKQ